ncbi:MAG: neuraminidase-like domain-containing protein [Candidatus Aminicenantes bacterium]|jgi:hypothetical protein
MVKQKQRNKIFRIEVQVLNRKDKKPVPGLRVEVWDKDKKYDQALGRATTDAKGYFLLEFNETDFKDRDVEKLPDVYFKIFLGDQMIKDTEDSIICNLASQETIIIMEVDIPGNQGKPFVVKGQVRQSDDRPLSGLLIRAVDKDLRHEQQLGEAATDPEGRYEVRYSPHQFRRAEKRQADLVIKVLNQKGKVIASSDIVFNAGPEQTIDLTLKPDQYRGPSEWETYLMALAPVLEKMTVKDLLEEDISFINGETGTPAEHLRFLRLDARWSHQHDVDQAVFYGLLRQGLPTEFRRLLAEKPSRLRETLKASIEQNIIPMVLETKIDDLLERLHELAVDVSFEQDNEAAAPPLGLLLSTAPDLNQEQQKQIVDFSLRHETAGQNDFWERLQKETNLDEKAIGTVKFTLESAPFLRGHLPSLQAVQELKVNRGWTKVQDLARLSRDEILQLTEQTAVNNPPKGFEDHKSFADAILHSLEVAFPTAVVAHGLAKDPELGSNDLNAFFAANETFDLLRTPVKGFIDNGAVPDNIQDPDALQQNLLELQRVLRIVPEKNRFANLKQMINQGYTSAFSVVNTGQAAFVETMTPFMDETEVKRTYENARARAEATQMFHQQIGDYITIPLPVIPHLRFREPEPEGELPTWMDLFGSLNFCACKHCRSMYSPAAYMVELLSFLDKAPESPGPLPELLKRRPDLKYIKLNCANASTVMPYIDLVNEILEAATASFPDERWEDRQTPGNGDASKAEVEARLRAIPEPGHEHSPAYEALENAVHPWLLPFSLNKEKINLFARHLGLNFVHVYEVFGRPDDWIAQAYLQLTDSEWERLITPVLDDMSVWGGVSLSNLIRVPIFLKQSGLTYEALQDLLDTVFLSTEGTPIITLDKGEDTCDINDYTLSGLEADVLDRIHRFLRLQNTIGWTINDLDKVLEAFEYTDITALSLRDIVRLARLADTYRQPPIRLITLDTTGMVELMQISEVEMNLFAGLIGVEDATALSFNSQLDLLEKWNEYKSTGVDLNELAYILLGRDQTPSVFTPLAVDSEAFLRALHHTVAETESELLLETIFQNLGQHLSLDPEVIKRLIAPVDETTSALIEAQSTMGVSAAEPAITDILHLMRDVEKIPEGSRASWDDPSGSVPESIKSAYDNVVWLLIRLDRVARLLNRLKITRPELDVIAQTQTENGFLDLNQLRAPHDLADHPQDVLYEQCRTLINAKQVQRALPRGEQGLWDFLVHPADTAEAMIDYLAEHTGWNRDPKTGKSVNVVKSLIQGLEHLEPTDSIDLNLFRRIETYERLNQAVAWLRRWRITPDTLALWANRDSTRITEFVDSLEATAHARFSNDEAWYKTLTPLMDKLREQKRDALLTYLISQNTGFKTPSDVYAYYLIDVEMSGCMLTSRIKQANASIQLFVQRILMNLETKAGLNASNYDYWNQWDWMKNYRVWEANRKVFLYPENWIEPELRDDKSPFFKELENELLQDEINDTSVERAFRHYLEKLDEVARLDVRGIYHEQDKDILHVFARTHSEPFIYFYCRRNAKKMWSSWEKINLNIEGDHLIPVVHNGRLMLFWAVFTEQESYWKLNIHWSEYRHREWEARKSANLEALLWLELYDISEHKAFTNTFPRHGFSFRTVQHNGTLEVRLFSSHVGIFAADPRRILGSVLEISKSYSIATFVFDECRQTLEINDQEEFVHFLKQPPNSAANYMNLTSKNAPLQIFTFVANNDVIEYDPLPAFYDSDDKEQATITLEEYKQATEELFNPAKDLTIPSSSLSLLESNISNSIITPGHQSRQFTVEHPFFFNTDSKTYLVTRHLSIKKFPQYAQIGDGSFKWRDYSNNFNTTFAWRYQFEIFYHPYLCNIIKHFYIKGFGGLFKPISHSPRSPGGLPIRNFLDRQFTKDEPSPLKKYDPTDHVNPLPKEEISFDLTDAYALYNWELFFHIPLLIGTRLSQNQRFEEAQRWFHYIFDPTEVSIHLKPSKYWRVKPFFELAQEPIETLSDLLRKIAEGNEQTLEQVQAWRDDPFNPHHIARLRNIAYMKNVVMKYIDNLIAWGDHLFQLDTIETINEATQLFILAAELLGERPVTIKQIDLPEFTYSKLTSSDLLDALNNAWIDLESRLPVELDGRLTSSGGEPLRLLTYFCIPANDKLFAYWDTVADRLFKIRHCMNIKGQVRQLPLFEPPIDPALLVRARAAGLDLRTVLSLTGEVALPHYRYTFTYQKALEFCSEVRSLGNALLAALEKRDAEELALLRSRHEMTLLTQTSIIKKKQIEEAKETLDSLHNARKLAEERLAYYSSRESRNAAEQAQVAHLENAHQFEIIAQGIQLASSILFAIPDFTVGLGGGATFGGSHLGNAMNAATGVVSMIASQYSYEASMSSLTGTYDRRQDDWDFQAELAATELEQIDKQIAAAEIRVAIAEQDLTNHEKQLDQAREVNDYMRSKFTNQELYGWMVGQLSALHYQAYQMAVDLARKAERAAQHELGLSPSHFQFIGFEHFDSQKKGLLAGERLYQELRRMDGAYMERNRRELEITRHVSLAMLNPKELIRLRETGQCAIHIPEVLFDLDYPGHYRRRIKSVSVTIPCVTGPYTNVSAKLTLESSRVRWSTDPDATLPLIPGNADSIATSSAQSDSGVFELNFRDERYLPFEGAGAISTWRLELSGKWIEVNESGDPEVVDLRQFDFDTISDVIIHINYTAKEANDDGTFKKAVIRNLQSEINKMVDSLETGGAGLYRLLSLRQEFSTQFHRFLHPKTADISHETSITIEKNHFPYFLQTRELTVQEIHVVLKPKNKDDCTRFDGQNLLLMRAPLPPHDAAPDGESLVVDPAEISPAWGGLPTATFSDLSGSSVGDWALRLNSTSLPDELTIDVDGKQRLNPDVIEDIFLVLRYMVGDAS